MGARLVAAFSASPMSWAGFEPATNRTSRRCCGFQRTSLLGRTVLTRFSPAIAVFLYGGQQIILGQMTIGTLVAFTGVSRELPTTPIQEACGLSASLSSARVSLSQYWNCSTPRAEVTETWGATALAPVRHSLELRNVTLRHGDRTITGRGITQNPDRSILSRSGPSGSGKSDCRPLYPLARSRQWLGPDRWCGHPHSASNGPSAESHVDRAIPHLMHGTLFWNISYPDSSVPRAHVEQAAHAAGLEELLARMPEGASIRSSGTWPHCPRVNGVWPSRF